MDRIRVQPAPGSEKCDFCSDRPVHKVYSTQDFALKDLGIGSEGAWAACQPCTTLIDTQNWHGLQQRAAKKLGKKMGLDPHSPEIINMIRRVHGEFRVHMRMEA